jgi:anaerobic magnesium-protoporphyrin IX monomethyl ester cyclase
MRIFLIQPPTNSLFSSCYVEPMGIACIGAVCKAAGHDVRLYDLLSVPLANSDDLFSQLDSFLPDIVGITSMTENFTNGLKIARAVKSRYSCTVIFGGWHVSGEPSSVMDPAIDYIVIGEGEETILELLSYLESKKGNLDDIRGIGFKKGDSFVVTNQRPRLTNIDNLPLPLRDGLPLDQYKFPLFYSHPLSKMRSLSMQASRGCPYKCSFCQTPAIWGNRWVNKNAVLVVDEIEGLINKYHINTLWFRDEEFTIRKKWVMEICSELIKRGINKHLSWGSFARVDDITEELAQCLSESGYIYGFLGIETGKAKSREQMNKHFEQNEAEIALNLFEKHGILACIGWILGLPWDTRESIEESFRWLLTLKVDFVYFTFATPFASTALRRQVEEQGLLLASDPDSFSTNKPIIRVPAIPYEELLKIPAELTRRFYFRPQYFWRSLKWHLHDPARLRASAEIGANIISLLWNARRRGKGGILANRIQSAPFIIPEKFFERL